MSDPRAEVLAAHEARAAHARLTTRIERARSELAAADGAIAEARARLADETADVERLESFSPSRIWAGLRGSRDADLDRERAEQQQAEYAVAAATAQRATALAEVERAEAERNELGGVERRWTEALRALDAWADAAGPEADELRDVTGRLAAARTEQVEVAQARDAAVKAEQRLRVAIDTLRRAEDWATWDTYAGGGMLTDFMKYNRMDEATAILQHADQALTTLARELADVDVDLAVVGPLGVTGLQAKLDIWFDNLYSDWTVRKRVQEATDRAGRAHVVVGAVLQSLDQRSTRLTKDEATLTARQTELAVRIVE